MPEIAAKADLLRSLGRLVRGLSALFWGLPLALLVCVKTAVSDYLRPLGIFPPLIATGLVYYGLTQLAYFHPQERVWRHALDRTKLLALINVGLAPFIFWWNRVPSNNFYFFSVLLLMLSGLLFLFNLNQSLQRLAAMLPDETLRMETRFFGSMNLYLLCGILILITGYVTVRQMREIPDALRMMMQALEITRQWLLIFMILLPMAMTMTLIWKIKEVVMASIFSDR
ncbi:MAG: hypothetical protein SFY81_00055 [Verrucomicrobiota bacterium]|nr:hypothetical protein [Verrucomicrobiota bacterium]